MVPRSIEPLLWSSLFALPTAVATTCCLPLAAALCLFGLAFASRTRHPCRHAGLVALPALLAALPLTQVTPMPLPDGPVEVRGRVARVVRVPSANTTHVYLEDARWSLRIVYDGDVEVLPGDDLRTLAHAAPAAGPELPRSLHGLAASLVVRPGPWSIPRLSQAVRRRLEVQLLRLVPGELGAMVATLALGRDTRTPPDLVLAHQDTGLSHLLAVSGAHAAMLAWLLGLAGRSRGRLLAAGPRRTLPMLGVLIVYAFVTGGEPPVLRAVIAFVLATAAAQLGRRFGVGNGLCVPALATCLVQPRALLGPSFLLSYAAVLGLTLAAAAPERSPSWWRRALQASWWATLLTAPLTAFFFGQLAPWTMLLTPVLAPLVAALLLLGLCAASLGCIAPALADLAAPPLQWLAQLYAGCVRLADHLPGTPVPVLVQPAPWLLVLAAFAVTCMLLLRVSRRRIAVAAVLLTVPFFLPMLAPAQTRCVLFSIGHGQSCLIETASGHRTAVDCGSLSHPYLAARLLEQALTVRRLDLLVITHADEDHHNGVPLLLRRVPIARAIVPAALDGSDVVEALRDSGTLVELLAPGEHREPAPHLRVAAPFVPPGTSDNDRSLWTQVQLVAVRVLLTGDAQELGVAAALADGIAAPCDVLVLPHHGRANAMAAQLLTRTRPRVVLASARTADGDTLLGPIARRFGADLWITGQHGTITLQGEPLRVNGSAGGRPVRIDRGPPP